MNLQLNIFFSFLSNQVQMQHFVFPNFWQSCRTKNLGGKFKSEAILQKLATEFKKPDQNAFYCTSSQNWSYFFLCLVQIDQSRSDKNRAHSKKHFFTVLVFFFVTIKLLKCQFNKSFWQDFLYIFLQFFLLLWCKFTISSLFQCFS